MRRPALVCVFVAALACCWAQQQLPAATLRDRRDLQIAGLPGGILLSPGYATGQHAPHGFLGGATIKAPAGYSRIRLDFEDFDLETSAQCSGDRVVISENRVPPRTMCSNVRPKPYLSSSPVVTVLFRTNGLKSSRGFRLRFTATNSQDVCNDRNLYECGTLDCIPRTQVCDGKFDCADGSDEQYCRVSQWRQHLVTDVACGSPVVQPATEDGDRIVGGREAVPHSWPWQPSIQLKGHSPAAHFCGGALLTNDKVITAGHCVSRMDADGIVVKFGSHNLVSDEAGVQIRNVQLIGRHSRFVSHDMTHDLAVLKLDVPVNFTDNVRPVCLPRHGETLPVNTTCYATGWGTTRGTGHSFLLKQARLTVRDFDQCRNILSFQPNLRGSHLVCALDESDITGPCHGDSGGPLVCQLGGTSSSSWSLVGMTSQGTELTVSNALCGMGAGTVWSGVIPNRAWIDSAVRNL